MDETLSSSLEVSYTKKSSFRSLLRTIYKTFSPTEKLIFSLLSLIILVISFTSFGRLYASLLIEVPSKGGSYTEGIIGTPRFINPVLATSDSDRDLSALIYSGLMKATTDGTLLPDLAEKYSISDDGLTYEFTLKDNLTFHNGDELTTADVAFTIKKIQDPFIKSQKRSAWDGVTVKVLDEKKIQFILKQPFAPFLENTIVGILPKSVWGETNSDEFAFSVYNIEPIGSGPFKFKKLKEDALRTPTEYILESFSDYSFHAPYLKSIHIKLYSNESELVSAFEQKDIDAMGGVNAQITKEYGTDGNHVYTADLPRVFGVFFNQSQNDILLNTTVRQALDMSAPRAQLVADVLGGYGKVINTADAKMTETDVDMEKNIEGANALLEKNGWVLNLETGVREKTINKIVTPLAFTLSTGDKRDLKFTAELLKEVWKQIGVDVTVNVYESGDLNQNIIRPRKYEALLFGEIIGRELDLYPFWHSSGRNDPGLNIALYANLTTDKILDNLRTETDMTKKEKLQNDFNTELAKDRPAVFLYAPQYTYISREQLHAFDLNQITLPSERFLDVHEWYVDTNKVWSLFIKPINN